MAQKKQFGQRILDHSLDEYCLKHSLLPKNSTIIVGLSGGPDSMVLLDYLAKKQHEGTLKVIAAHLDHQWREHSYEDITFCQLQADKRNVKLIVAKATEMSYKPKFNGSKEDLGRKLRRYFLESVAYQEKAYAIALAHHMNDQQETFFIRLLRGSSLTGLTGMKPWQDGYIRPLLETPRSEIMRYITEHSIEYLTDPTNESDAYLRNRIRTQVLPALRSTDIRFDNSFSRTLAQLQETENFLSAMSYDILKRSCINYNGLCALKIHDTKILHPVLRKRVILAWLVHEKVPFTPSDTMFQEIFRFIEKQGSRHHIHPQWSLCKKNGLMFVDQ